VVDTIDVLCVQLASITRPRRDFSEHIVSGGPVMLYRVWRAAVAAPLQAPSLRSWVLMLRNLRFGLYIFPIIGDRVSLDLLCADPRAILWSLPRPPGAWGLQGALRRTVGE
jgi:hypothetical protein